MQKIALGGGCHWCTEAVFQSLRGVILVEQGWVSSTHPDASEWSEAVVVHYDPSVIPLDILVEIHLYTHNATSNHTFRQKYRSVVYTFSVRQQQEAEEILAHKSLLFSKPLVTRVYPFKHFRLNKACYLNYYKNDPDKPFCTARIAPKLATLMTQYADHYIPLTKS